MSRWRCTESGQQPILGESEKPSGAWDWQPEELPSNMQEIDIYHEGPDMMAEGQDSISSIS